MVGRSRAHRDGGGRPSKGPLTLSSRRRAAGPLAAASRRARLTRDSLSKWLPFAAPPVAPPVAAADRPPPTPPPPRLALVVAELVAAHRFASKDTYDIEGKLAGTRTTARE